MFSQRKNFLKNRWFALVVIGLLGLGYYINQEKVPAQAPDNPNRETGISQRIDTGDTFGAEHDGEDDVEFDKFADTESYYLIKEDAGIISIYLCNEKGEQSFLSKTDIAFDLLGEVDQSLFTKGIIKTSKEELEELLQDFGS